MSAASQIEVDRLEYIFRHLHKENAKKKRFRMVTKSAIEVALDRALVADIRRLSEEFDKLLTVPVSSKQAQSVARNEEPNRPNILQFVSKDCGI